MCEPLKNKIWNIIPIKNSETGEPDIEWLSVKKKDADYRDNFAYLDAKSAVKGLIKYHEDNIEDIVKSLSRKTPDHPLVLLQFGDIIKEYESIMAIELWLEDAI